MILCTALVMLMAPGLAQFYGGMVKVKNMINTMMLSAICMGLITIQWVVFGYTFSFGGGNQVYGSFQYVGLRDVGLTSNPVYGPTIPHLLYCCYQLMFAILSQSILSGAVVERMTFRSWIVFVLLWTTLCYDMVAHWMWSRYLIFYPDTGNFSIVSGWLKSYGALDWAGGCAVHIAPGVSSMVAVLILGKRNIDKEERKRAKPSNTGNVITGAGILWFGWFGFNAGGGFSATGIAVLAVANTQIAAATGFISFLAFDWILKGKPSAVGAFSGAIIGLVAITPGAGFVPVQTSLAFGFIASVICYLWLLLKNKYFHDLFPGFDDSLDVATGHGLSGIIGCILVGFFADASINTEITYSGIFFGGDGRLLGWQIVAICCTSALAAVVTFVVLMALKLTCKIRITAEEEEIGQDAFFMEQISHAQNGTGVGENSVRSRAEERQTGGDNGDDGGSHTERSQNNGNLVNNCNNNNRDKGVIQ